ncbi:MAG TPA: SPOR domain-containing protein [Gemmatimonadaceae bacterium]|nr:SPOR domain-containing protein [Gemmatimonadaceae bacterium]
MRLLTIAALLLAAATTSVSAQSTSSAVYARAQTLVSEGQGAEGRALVDSMYRISAPSSNERAEALFWRASLAAAAADAERDYRAIVVDHATSPRVEDALLRLAQLELARGDRAAALRNLQRLAAEFPNSRQRARTSYWTARVLFDNNDIAAACAANADALARSAGDIELTNQIQYQQQRCRGVVAASPTSDSTRPAVQTRPPLSAPPVPRDVTPSIPLERPIPVAATPASRTYSVQVAAANTRAIAQSIVNRMAGRGYQARIDGTAAPFRVRVGRYATRAEATRALAAMKAKGIDGFVATIEAR